MDNITSSKTSIVIDLGSSSIKVGLGNQENPSFVFPNYIGKIKYPKIGQKSIEILENEKSSKYFIGNDCKKYQGVLKLNYPMEHGIFSDPEDISTILNYINYNLEVNNIQMSEHPILISEPLLNPKKNREKIAKELFDKLKVKALFFASQPILSMFSTSTTSGIILESGDGVTQSCICYDGYAIPSSFKRINFGGREITEYLQLLLNKKGYSLMSSDGFQIVKKIKEELCCCGIEEESKYILPDDSEIVVGNEKHQVTELLFDPSINGYEYESVQKIIANSLNQININIDLRSQLYGNILLSGGNMKFNGMKERLHKEIKKLSPKNIKVGLHLSSNAENACWIGGSVISGLEAFKEMYVTEKEYREKTDQIIHIKAI